MTDAENKASPDSTVETPVGNIGVNGDETDMKSPLRSVEKEKEKDDGDVDDENVESEQGGGDGSTEKKALFESPVVMEGKRQRKKTERLSEVISKEKSEEMEKSEKKKAIVVPDGSGTKLGDIPFVEYMISKTKSDDLNLLHRCLYGVYGDHHSRRSNIRKFSGFTFTKDGPEYEKKLEFLNRIFRAELVKQFNNILGIKQESKKEVMTKIVLDYLMCPEDSGKKPPQSKRKKTSGDKKKKKASNKSKEEKKKKPKKKKDEDEQSDQDAESDQDVSEEDAEGDGDSESEDSPPKKKAKKAASPKKTEKKATSAKSKKPAKKKETPKKKDAAKKKKSPKKTPSKAAKQVELSPDTSDLGGDSDDEPLVKKLKTKPTDDEIQDLVSKILDSSSLEELSIRKVFQQVQDTYPEFDLSDKQKFVKTTVKELIN